MKTKTFIVILSIIIGVGIIIAIVCSMCNPSKSNKQKKDNNDPTMPFSEAVSEDQTVTGESVDLELDDEGWVSLDEAIKDDEKEKWITFDKVINGFSKKINVLDLKNNNNDLTLDDISSWQYKKLGTFEFEMDEHIKEGVYGTAYDHDKNELFTIDTYVYVVNSDDKRLWAKITMNGNTEWYEYKE